MKKNKMIFFLAVVFISFISNLILAPVYVKGQIEDSVKLVNPLGEVTDINILLGTVVGKVLAILGSLALVAFVVGGFLWLTSAGNAEKIKQGMNTMLYAIIGLFVIFASYAILNTVLNGLGANEQGGVSNISGKCMAGTKTMVDWCKKSVEEGGSCDDSVCKIQSSECVPQEGKTTGTVCPTILDKDTCQELEKDGYCKFISSN